MKLIAILCISNFLQYSSAQGSTSSFTSAHYFNAAQTTQERSTKGEAKLGPVISEETNVKSRKIAMSRSSNGRPVEIPPENIASMAGLPFSTLSTINNVTLQNIIVEVHNNFRRTANPPASNMLKMIWNNEAAQSAARWASTCNEFHSTQEQRRITNFGCGENIFMSSFQASWIDVITSFHSEYVDFVFGKGARIKGQVVGHYTQVMWYRSYQVGCHVSQCNKSIYKFFYVCHYCPPGNTNQDGRPYKSGPACADCPSSCDNGLCTNYCKAQDWYRDCSVYNQGTACQTDKRFAEDCPATCKCTNNEIK
ncbi:cysteine-rich venom protein DIS2-like [Rhinophrynus dorsalis]